MLSIRAASGTSGHLPFVRSFATTPSGSSWGGYDYDVTVIGSGPGGHAVSLGCTKHGLRVACIESKRLGGTCLNTGCIPSKCLLHSSKMYYSLVKGGKSHFGGISLGRKGTQDPLNLVRTMEHKDNVVRAIMSDVGHDFQRHGICYINAHARLTERPGEVRLSNGRTLRSRYIVLAPGSVSRRLPQMDEFDERHILSSAGALSLGHVPTHLVVVGAGVNGLELGTVWHRFGSKVTFVDSLGRVANGTETEVASHVRSCMERQGMRFLLNTQVTSIVRRFNTVEVRTARKLPGGKKTETICAGSVVVCIGRSPAVEGLGLDAAGVKTKGGSILVDEHYRTSVKNVYAVGDAIGGPMLAHKAESEGYSVARGLGTGTLPAKVNYNAIPGVLFTTPEVAWVSEDGAVSGHGS